jgi:molybdopterin molybdotransferase
MYPSGSKLADPLASLMRLADRLAPVPESVVPLNDAGGRVLATDVLADRDHPPVDVSAVDGYALRMAQAGVGRKSIVAESRIGAAAPQMPGDGVVKIATGAPVPQGAEAVVRREEVREELSFIEIARPLSLKPDQDIRRCGTNIRAGERVLTAGVLLGPSQMAALAAMGFAQVRVRRPVRVAMIVTGDELVEIDRDPQPYQIRESHSPAVRCALGANRWIDLVNTTVVRDDFALIVAKLAEDLAGCDAVLLSGGVSMGDRDFVPDAVRQIGGEIVFHGLALRPGRPTLGAVGPRGQAVIGLPGNPLSVLVTVRRLAAIALRKLAGMAEIDPPAPRVSLTGTATVHREFRLFPPAVLTAEGSARIVPAKNSGDLIAAAQTDGFVEIPPGDSAPSLVSFYSWALT